MGKGSLLPLCVMVPWCYTCVYETQHRARGLGIGAAAETHIFTYSQTCCSNDTYDVCAALPQYSYRRGQH